jgi:hypothetical protein
MRRRGAGARHREAIVRPADRAVVSIPRGFVMKHLPYYLLALAVTGAMAVVFGPCASGPAEPRSVPVVETLVAPPPEAAALRMLAKRHIARDVAAGRRSLVEAAALFRALNSPAQADALSRDDPHPWALTAPARTDDERLCRQVVEWVGALRLTESPEYAAAAVARVNAEYREELRQHGAIRLPDPAGLPTAEELLEKVRATMTERERKTFANPGPGGRKR